MTYGLANEDGNTILRFSGRYRFLSNFWPAKVAMGGFEFPSVENAYQAAKLVDRIERHRFCNCTAAEAKRIGRTAQLPVDWENLKIDVMADLLCQKFSIQDLRKQLLDTRGLHIMEGNTWGDTFWGVDLRTGEGRNTLGNMLMHLRQELRNV